MKLGCQLEPVCTVLDFTARFLKKNMEHFTRRSNTTQLFILFLLHVEQTLHIRREQARLPGIPAAY